MTRIRSFLLLIVLVTGAALVACGGGSGPTERDGRGVVVDVDVESGQVTLDHEDIPDLMKAMTMTFDVVDPTQLESLKEGDRVGFRLRYADGNYTITAIEAP